MYLERFMENIRKNLGFKKGGFSLENKKEIYLNEDFYKIDIEGKNENYYLWGSRCKNCGEIYFPKKIINFCGNCNKEELEVIKLSNFGKIAGYTIAYQKPAGGYYKGMVPYAYGFVDLPEGVRVQTQFIGNHNDLKIGKTVKLEVKKIGIDKEGNTLLTYVFCINN